MTQILGFRMSRIVCIFGGNKRRSLTVFCFRILTLHQQGALCFADTRITCLHLKWQISPPRLSSRKLNCWAWCFKLWFHVSEHWRLSELMWLKHQALIVKVETGLFPVFLFISLILYIHIFHVVPAAVKQLKETVSSSIHKLANFDGKSSAKFQGEKRILSRRSQTLMFVAACVSAEVMDAHLQNNQTAEDILASPDQLKSKESLTASTCCFNQIDWITARKLEHSVGGRVIWVGRSFGWDRLYIISFQNAATCEMTRNFQSALIIFKAFSVVTKGSKCWPGHFLLHWPLTQVVVGFLAVGLFLIL